jgi:hypothetical protein
MGIHPYDIKGKFTMICNEYTHSRREFEKCFTIRPAIRFPRHERAKCRLFATPAASQNHEGIAQGHPLADKDSLGPRDYRDIMDKSLFAPCPADWANLDSFRVWEDAGGGLHSHRRKKTVFRLFQTRRGRPSPADGGSWSQAPALVESFGDDTGRIEALRRQCCEWWQTYKQEFDRRIAGVLHSL